MFKIVMKFCPITANQKGWEMELPGEFSSKEQAAQYLKENARQLAPPIVGNRMLFGIVEKSGGDHEQ